MMKKYTHHKMNKRNIVKINYLQLYKKIPDYDFKSFTTKEKIDIMAKWGIEYTYGELYDVVIDNELFSLFLLEHPEVVEYIH